MVKWDSGGLPQSPQLMGDTGTRLKINLEKFMRLNRNKRFVSQNTRNGESVSDSATCEIVISSMEFGIGSKWFTNVRLSYVTEYRCQTSTSPSSYHPDVSLPRESKIGERGPTWNSSPLTEQLPVYSGSEREREHWGSVWKGLARCALLKLSQNIQSKRQSGELRRWVRGGMNWLITKPTTVPVKPQRKLCDSGGPLWPDPTTQWLPVFIWSQ